MRRFIRTGILITAAALVTSGSAAQPARCGARADIVEQLEQRYGESQRALGIAADQRLVEVFASDGGSWTILLTDPRGRSCLMAAGRDFQAVAPRAPGQPA